ncbi:LPXTG cell wall anchor domain-containing protein [Butyricimonas virosa]|uniref:LPXTG cell wall anchor domain-containing protein n=1 Tax=Butyricimonas virosa TaxID=544645 RepID=A0A412WTF9_9BACT|nr:LPXTG cell wall anchor domain-containing protein [Butyricimonas virosa]
MLCYTMVGIVLFILIWLLFRKRRKIRCGQPLTRRMSNEFHR